MINTRKSIPELIESTILDLETFCKKTGLIYEQIYGYYNGVTPCDRMRCKIEEQVRLIRKELGITRRRHASSGVTTSRGSSRCKSLRNEKQLSLAAQMELFERFKVDPPDAYDDRRGWHYSKHRVIHRSNDIIEKKK